MGYYLDHLLCLFSLNLLGLQCLRVELEKVALLLSWPRQDKCFFHLTIFLFIFAVTLVKKVIKIVGNFFRTCYIWPEIDSSDFFFMFIIPLMICHTSLRYFFIVFKILLVVRIFCLSKQWRYMITIWFELPFIISFCFSFWSFPLQKLLYNLFLFSHRIGQTRSDPWFIFVSSFWIFDSFIWRMFI